MEYLVISFLNTFWFLTHKEKKDPLKDPDVIHWFMKRMVGTEVFEALPPDELPTHGNNLLPFSDELIAFRSEMMALIAKIEADNFDETEAIALLNGYLSQSEGHRTIVTRGAEAPALGFEPNHADKNFLIAQLASDFFELFFEMDRTRIKICENPDCICYFYDISKNKTKRHCAPNCSNLMKVRRHREKKNL